MERGRMLSSMSPGRAREAEPGGGSGHAGGGIARVRARGAGEGRADLVRRGGGCGCTYLGRVGARERIAPDSGKRRRNGRQQRARRRPPTQATRKTGAVLASLRTEDFWTRALAAVPQSAVPRCAWGGGLDTAATRRHRGEPTPTPTYPPHTPHITPPRPVRLPPQHTPSPSVRGPALSQCEWLA